MTDEIFKKEEFREALKELYREYGIQASTAIVTDEQHGAHVFLFGAFRDRYSSIINAIRSDLGIRNEIMSSVTAELADVGVMTAEERMQVLDGVYKQIKP
jgi:hypothetical protein